MEDKELEIIEKRLGGCTPAPWITGSIPWQVWCDGGHGKICRVESCASDREFIAHARQDVPALLDEVRKLKLQVREVEFQLNDAREAIKTQRREVKELREWARAHWDADAPLIKKLDGMLYTPFTEKPMSDAIPVCPNCGVLSDGRKCRCGLFTEKRVEPSQMRDPADNGNYADNDAD